MVQSPRPVLSIWAHYDDDLIFGCPTIDTAVTAGAPVTTLFLTASDAGRDADYVRGRAHGLRLAYEVMHGSALTWRERSTTLDGGAMATVWEAASAPITLMTLGLPDGRPNGTGFEATGNASLRQLLEGGRDEIDPIEAGTALTAGSLTKAISDVMLGMLRAHPDSRLLTHAPRIGGTLTERDHSDHWSTGAFVRRAIDEAAPQVQSVSWRIGYPSAALPATLSGAVLARKVDVFRAYAAHDPVVARPDAASTLELRGFGDWLQREYELIGAGAAAV